MYSPGAGWCTAQVLVGVQPRCWLVYSPGAGWCTAQGLVGVQPRWYSYHMIAKLDLLPLAFLTLNCRSYTCHHQRGNHLAHP